LVPLVDFLVPVELADFLVVEVLELVVVEAVSSLCAQETTKAAPAATVINPTMNFFIVAGYFGLKAETVKFVASGQVICAVLLRKSNGPPVSDVLSLENEAQRRVAAGPQGSGMFRAHRTDGVSEGY
jgi:hypothetical protein